MKNILIIMLLFLAGCANKSTIFNTDKQSDQDNVPVVTSGVSFVRGFSADNSVGVQTYNTKAPFNQTYNFKFDNSSVDSKYFDSIHAQANYLNNNPLAKILLEGHTDERGSREYNIALGERRAKSVYDILILANVDPQQIRIVSYGEEQPVNIAKNEQAYQENRRVELKYERIK